MATTSLTYFTLSPPPSRHRHLSPRRYPLTPPCVSPAAITAYQSRPELNRSQTSPKATALLSKVARTSPSSRRTSPSPSARNEKHSSYQGPPEHEAHEEKLWVEEVRDWRGGEQSGGYVSFPDFERFCPQYGAQEETPHEGQRTLQT
ncbi:hypothetical protein BT63DRAFT_413645 [Microthyrium microscopicum]|uniref:Uncharacterized protein n=1 Tax=Microthyrium microscopicum TaxID=703497 RepID=A0A6A6UCL6_9PEZI|nr:hypothetical protein BT63DRAFT_413645 [Microthyrium microscopicum]